MSLVELLIVLGVLSVIGAMSLGAFTSGVGALGRAEEDAQGQADVTIGLERLTKELRQVRRLRTGTGPAQLVAWLDRDGDAVMSPAETVTWRVVTAPPGTGQFHLLRVDGSGTATTLATTLTSGQAFTFNAADPTRASTVSVELRYDAKPGAHLGEKIARAQVRLRNLR